LESSLFSVPWRVVIFSCRPFTPDTDSIPLTTVDVPLFTSLKGASMRWKGFSASAGVVVEDIAKTCSRTRLKTNNLFSRSKLIHPPTPGKSGRPSQSNRTNDGQPPWQSLLNPPNCARLGDRRVYILS